MFLYIEWFLGSNYDILFYFQPYLTLFCGLKKKRFRFILLHQSPWFLTLFYIVFLILSRWLWNTFIWKKMWKVPLIVQGPTINWFQWKLTTKLEFWRWDQRFLFSSKVGKILKVCLDSISSPSVKIQIIGRKVCLRCKGKTLLGIVNKILKRKSLFCRITSSKLSRQ